MKTNQDKPLNIQMLGSQGLAFQDCPGLRSQPVLGGFTGMFTDHLVITELL